MLTAIIVLLVLNFGLSLLTLTANIEKLKVLTETNSSALDCLVSVDAALDIVRRNYLEKVV